MRVEFVVTPTAGGWLVRRGQTAGLRCGTREQALTAAENMARAVSERGDTAMVTLAADGGPQQMARFSAQRAWSAATGPNPHPDGS